MRIQNSWILHFALSLLSFNALSQSYIWAEKYSGTNTDYLVSIDSDEDDNIYIVGNGNTPNLDSYTLPTSGIDGFIAKYNKNRDLVWAKAAGGLNTYSDSTLKTNIAHIESSIALSKVLSMNAYTFDFTRKAFLNTPDELMPRVLESSQGQIGFIAQELESIVPEVVKYSEKDGLYTVDYIKLIPLLVEAIKAQQAEIEELKKRIE